MWQADESGDLRKDNKYMITDFDAIKKLHELVKPFYGETKRRRFARIASHTDELITGFAAIGAAMLDATKSMQDFGDLMRHASGKRIISG